MELPFEDNSFDYVTIGFGLRNVPDYMQVLKRNVSSSKTWWNGCLFRNITTNNAWYLNNYISFIFVILCLCLVNFC